MIPAKFEIQVKADGSYCLIIYGSIKYDDLTFNEAIRTITEFETMEEEKK